MADNAKKKRRLTDQEVAVLAAIERRGSANVRELGDDFPDSVPRTLRRVCNVLETRPLIRSEGTPDTVPGGVRFFPVGVSDETDPRLTRLHAKIATPTITSWIDSRSQAVAILVPVTEIGHFLTPVSSGPAKLLSGERAGAFRIIRDKIRELENWGALIDLEVDSDLVHDGARGPALLMRIRDIPHGPELW